MSIDKLLESEKILMAEKPEYRKAVNEARREMKSRRAEQEESENNCLQAGKSAV